MPGAKIGEIYGELRIKLDKLRKDLSDSLRHTEDFRAKAGKAFKQFATVITGAFVAASAAIIKTTKDTVVFAERMRGFAKATNMAVEDVQEFAYAAEQEHASMESFSRGVKNLTIRLDYAGKGMETYTRYFDALNIRYKNADGSLRNVKDVFLDLSDAISHGTLTTEKQAAVIQLLGSRAGQELLPMLKKGKQWFYEMAEEAKQMGYVMREEDIEAIKDFDDKFLALKSAFNATKRELVLGMLPTLDSLAQKLKDNGKEAQAFRASMRDLGESIGTATNQLVEWGTGFVSWWKGVWENLGKEKVRDQIAWLEVGIQKLYDAAAAGKIPAEEAAKQINYLKTQIKFLNDSLDDTKDSADKASGSPKGDSPGGGIAGITTEIENLGLTLAQAAWANEELMQEMSDWMADYNHQIVETAWANEDLMKEMHDWMQEYLKNQNKIKISADEAAESVGELFGTYIKEGGNALAMLKKVVGQQLRLNFLSKFGVGGNIVSGFMQVLGFEEGGTIPRNMPVLNMAVYNENPKRPETAFRTPRGDTSVIPWDKMPQMVKVETYVTNANPDTQVRTFIKANPDAMDELYRYGIRPAMLRDGQR